MKESSLCKPRFNGPSAFGARPGHPIFYVLPVSGDPLSITAEKIPDGVVFDPVRRSVTGRISVPGVYPMTFAAENKNGLVRFSMNLNIGEQIQLAPPMGWNSWYCLSETVSDAKLRETAAGMVERGLSAFGWSYINIDDCWQGVRGGKYHALQPNERFPDMGALAEYIHALGLRIGIYSTPWISTYAGFRGGSTDRGFEERMYLPEDQRLQPNQVFGRFPGGRERGQYRTGSEWLFENDIRQWADWGIDFVKVDWNPNDIPTTERIASELRTCGRDIVLSLSNTAPVEFGKELLELSQLCRITGDIRDTWESISKIGFDHDLRWHGCFRPGHWIDPDMLQIGAIGIPNRQNITYQPSRLTYEEQRTQFTLWSLLSAPLLLSCDVAGMDDSTFALLTNPDVIAVNQDSLAAVPIIEKPSETLRIYRKPLLDGSLAIGVFNLSDELLHTELEMPSSTRELWTGTESGADHVKMTIQPHGVAVYRTKPLV